MASPQEKIELFEALRADEIAVRVLHNELSGGSLDLLSYTLSGSRG